MVTALCFTFNSWIWIENGLLESNDEQALSADIEKDLEEVFPNIFLVVKYLSFM